MGKEHKPTPWRVSEWRNTNSDDVPVFAADGTWLGDFVVDDDDDTATSETPKINADYCVRAVNCHDDLLAACKEAAEVLRVQLDYDPEEGSAEWVAHDTLLAAIAKAEATE